MSEIAERYRRLAQGFTAKVEAVPESRWEDQSPCEEWTAREVVGHVITAAHRFFDLVGLPVPTGPSVQDDPVAAWANTRDALQAALDDPAVAGIEYDGLGGRSTLEVGVDRFLGFDLVVHAWDLARATGLDERLDPADVIAVREAALAMGDVLRLPGVCGPELQPPEGADDQTRLLALLGRRA